MAADKQWLQVPYKAFLKSRAVWAIIAAHFCFNWGYYTLLAWLPSYFDLALGLKVDKSSIYTLIPYLSMVVMTPLVGPVADGLIARGWATTRVRKLCQGVSFAGATSCCGAMRSVASLHRRCGIMCCAGDVQLVAVPCWHACSCVDALPCCGLRCASWVLHPSSRAHIRAAAASFDRTRTRPSLWQAWVWQHESTPALLHAICSFRLCTHDTAIHDWL